MDRLGGSVPVSNIQLDLQVHLSGPGYVGVVGENIVMGSPPEIVTVADQDRPAPIELSSQELYADSQVFPGDEPLLFSQGTLEFLSEAINPDGAQNPSTSSLLNSSFSFSDMDGAARELSQGDGEGGGVGYEVEFPCSQRNFLVPTQTELPDNIMLDDDETYAQDNLLSPETEEFYYETGLFGIPASGQTSCSQESSQGERMPALTNYPGKYNFLVEPIQQGGKKWIIWPEENRIYCSKNSEILFSFGLDFATAPLKNLAIEAMLVFSSNESMNTPVPRCKACFQEEVDNNQPPGNSDIYRHVLRSAHPRAQHLQYEKNERWYVTVPLEKPQIGEHTIMRNYKFTCLNSCKFGGINRRETAVMFFLVEGTKQVGRCCYNVKVCTGPSRDYLKDVKKHDDEQNQDKSSRKRKGFASSSSVVDTDENDSVAPLSVENLERETKHGRFGNGSRSATTNGNADLNALPPRSVAGCSKQENVGEQDSQEICNSQESLSGEFVERLHDNIKLALRQRKNPDPKHKIPACTAINIIKGFQKSMDYYRDYVLEEPTETEGIKEEEEEGEDDAALGENENAGEQEDA